MRLKKLRLSITSGIFSLVIISVYVLGLFDHYNEASYEREFAYPLNVDIRPLVEQYRAGLPTSILPINVYHYEYLNKYESKCSIKIRLVILVKSAIDNFDRRLAIRSTWGLENRFPGVKILTVFFVGKSLKDADVQRKIDTECRVHGDVIQTNAVDSYFNNTLKTMLAFKWAYEYCNKGDYYLFSDDDMYISTKNVLTYLESNDKNNSNTKSMLYTGYVFNSTPHRHITSRWYVDLEEYPYDRWPTYVTAGAYLLSNEAMKNMYIASLFVKHFRFDDIYLGIVSKKLGIIPKHNTNFYFYKKKYSINDYKDVIASHGYSSADELMRIWNDQLLVGFA